MAECARQSIRKSLVRRRNVTINSHFAEERKKRMNDKSVKRKFGMRDVDFMSQFSFPVTLEKLFIIQ